MYGQYTYPTYPNTYQRQMVNPQQQFQIPQVQPQMQMQMEIPIQDIKYVNKAQAEAYIVYPNSKVMLIDKDNKVVYIKTADNTGLSTTEYYKFEPMNADGTPIKPKEEKVEFDMSDYIKKSDLENFGFVTIDQLDRAIEKLTNRQTGVKNNGAGTNTK